MSTSNGEYMLPAGSCIVQDVFGDSYREAIFSLLREAGFPIKNTRPAGVVTSSPADPDVKAALDKCGATKLIIETVQGTVGGLKFIWR